MYPVYSNELYHHGILGQKWGVRRFQNKDGTLTAAGKKRYDVGGPKPTGGAEDNQDGPSAQNQQKGLTDKQKTALKIAAGVTLGAVAAYGGYRLYKAYNEMSPIDPATGLPKLRVPESAEESLYNINPGRVHFLNSKVRNLEMIRGSSQNCMLCTTTYELRRRGFDVKAGFSTTGFLPDQLFPKIYKDYKGTTKLEMWDIRNDRLMHFMPNEMMNRVVSNISDMPDGARGNIMVWWKTGGGHSMIFEKTNSGVVFKDGQTGKEYKDFAKEVLAHVDSGKYVELLRTDNLTLDLDGIKKYTTTGSNTKIYCDNAAKVAEACLYNGVANLAIYGAVGAAVYHSNKKQANARKGGQARGTGQVTNGSTSSEKGASRKSR